MSTISKPYTFSPSTTASSSEVNADFDTLYNDYNGNINASNLATGAVSTAKIADDAVTGDKIADAVVTSTHINFGGSGAGVWWEEIARTTLGSAGDTITVSSIPARQYLKVIVNLLSSGQIATSMRFNNDSSANYANRRADNGGAGATAVSQSSIVMDTGADTANMTIEINILNMSGKEKTARYIFASSGSAGAASAPNISDGNGKWVNTSAQISRIDIINTGTGDFATASEVIVLGHN